MHGRSSHDSGQVIERELYKPFRPMPCVDQPLDSPLSLSLYLSISLSLSLSRSISLSLFTSVHQTISSSQPHFVHSHFVSLPLSVSRTIFSPPLSALFTISPYDLFFTIHQPISFLPPLPPSLSLSISVSNFHTPTNARTQARTCHLTSNKRSEKCKRDWCDPRETNRMQQTS